MVWFYVGKGTESFQAEIFGGVSSLNCISSIQKPLIFCNQMMYKMYVHMYCKILGLL